MSSSTDLSPPSFTSEDVVYWTFTLSDDNVVPDEIPDGKYILTRWNTNAHVDVVDSHFTVSEVYGAKLEVGQEYLIIKPRY